MNRKLYTNFSSLVVLFAIAISLLFMPQPSRANIWVEDGLDDIDHSIRKLSNQIGVLIEIENKQNEILERIESKLTNSSEAKTDKNE